ncbi:MAG: sulfatase [Bryobacteraceae bacterium]
MLLRDLRGTRRNFLHLTGMAALGSAARAQTRPPNIVVIYADDLGYGDLGCYGSQIQTPHLDAMAAQGMRFTHFYSASSVCSPSRAALLTGRYPIRTGVPRVLGQNDAGGLDESETTLAEMLRSAGYATACIGKWHLGNAPGATALDRGFDSFFGIPYSHDMWPRPLMVDRAVVEQPAQVEALTRRFTDRAVDFIAQSKDRPFFLYMPHTAPHIPLAPGKDFDGRSGQGAYGDVVQEMDWSVGQVLEALRANGVDENTLVLFSSDNGPWYQGSPGLLRGRKGQTYEGGMRVPLIARWPGRIPEGAVSDAFASTMDVVPTVARWTGAPLPANRLDGADLSPVLTGEASQVERGPFFYFNDIYLQCARIGEWKLHISRFDIPAFVPLKKGVTRVNLRLPRPELYNVVHDPEESYDRASRNPEIVASIQAAIAAAVPTFPAGVIDAHQETMRRRVRDTPTAAPPEEAEP